MSLKGKLEAIIYAAEEPVSLDQLATVLQQEVIAEQNLASEADASTLSAVKSRLRALADELMAEYSAPDCGMEIRMVAGGYRMATKPEHHDAVRGFAKSLKPPIRLSLQALETLAVIAYKQPITAPEIQEIRGVDSSGVLATLLDRKLITTAGRKAVIGRPILYKTSKDFLLRFGLKDVSELPSMEEFEKLITSEVQGEMFAVPQSESGVLQPVPASSDEPSPRPLAAEEQPEPEEVNRR
ncbi:MAG TPA: SMC-Scp complex subunit ScpB [Terriglobales bacterium]|nr:SMC-Scp complex subunit ScpB [Terriglobales bacterium]